MRRTIFTSALLWSVQTQLVLTEADEYSYCKPDGAAPGEFPEVRFRPGADAIRAQLEGMEAEVYGTFAGKEVTEESLTAALSACGAKFVKQTPVTVLRKLPARETRGSPRSGTTAPRKRVCMNLLKSQSIRL